MKLFDFVYITYTENIIQYIIYNVITLCIPTHIYMKMERARNGVMKFMSCHEIYKKGERTSV